MAQRVNNLPTMKELQETQFQSLGREDPLEEGTQFTPIFLKENPKDRGAWWTMVHMVSELDTTEAT